MSHSDYRPPGKVFPSHKIKEKFPNEKRVKYRERINKSICWEFFIRNDSTEKLSCSMCNKVFSGDPRHGTSNLLRHLKLYHPTVLSHPNLIKKKEKTEINRTSYKLEEKSTKRLPFVMKTEVVSASDDETLERTDEDLQNALHTDSQKSLHTENVQANEWNSKKKKSHRKLLNLDLNSSICEMLSNDLLPVSMIEGKGFQSFIKLVNPSVSIPDSKTFFNTGNLSRMVAGRKYELKANLKKSRFFSLSLESWLYQNMCRYMTVRVHFITQSWKREWFVIDVVYFDEEAAADTLALSIKKIADEWGITEQVVSLVSDLDSEVIKMAAAINGWTYFLCFGHILDMKISEILNNVSEVAKVQEKCFNVISHFKKNDISMKTLYETQEQNNIPSNDLFLPSPSKGTLILAMFKLMIQQFEALNTVLCVAKKADLCICDEEIEVVKLIVQLLSPFTVIVEDLCSVPYIFISKLIALSNLLSLNVLETEDCMDSPDLKLSILSTLKHQVESHFVNMEEMEFLAIGTLLDPRFKKPAFVSNNALENAEDGLRSELLPMISGTSSTSKNTVKSHEANSFWSRFDQRVSIESTPNSNRAQADNEIQRYFKEPNVDREDDPLQWWCFNEVQFPNLKILVQKYLCTPATASSSKHIFDNEAKHTFTRRLDLLPQRYLKDFIFLSNS